MKKLITTLFLMGAWTSTASANAAEWWTWFVRSCIM